MRNILRPFLSFWHRTGLWIPIAISLMLGLVIWMTISLMQDQRPRLTNFVLPDPEDIKREEQAEVVAHRGEILILLRGMHREVTYCKGGYNLAMTTPAEDIALVNRARASAEADCAASQDRLDKLVMPKLASTTVTQRLEDASVYCLAAIEQFRARLAELGSDSNADGESEQRSDCFSALRYAGSAAGLSQAQLYFLPDEAVVDASKVKEVVPR